jgi:hypothetical protein
VSYNVVFGVILLFFFYLILPPKFYLFRSYLFRFTFLFAFLSENILGLLSVPESFILSLPYILLDPHLSRLKKTPRAFHQLADRESFFATIFFWRLH